MRLSYHDTLPYLHQKRLGLDKIRQSDSSYVEEPLPGKTEALSFPPANSFNRIKDG